MPRFVNVFSFLFWLTMFATLFGDWVGWWTYTPHKIIPVCATFICAVDYLCVVIFNPKLTTRLIKDIKNEEEREERR